MVIHFLNSNKYKGNNQTANKQYKHKQYNPIRISVWWKTPIKNELTSFFLNEYTMVVVVAATLEDQLVDPPF